MSSGPRLGATVLIWTCLLVMSGTASMGRRVSCQAPKAVTSTGRLDALVHNATSNASSRPHQLTDVDRSLWPAAELSVRAQLEYLRD